MGRLALLIGYLETSKNAQKPSFTLRAERMRKINTQNNSLVGNELNQGPDKYSGFRFETKIWLSDLSSKIKISIIRYIGYIIFLQRFDENPQKYFAWYQGKKKCQKRPKRFTQVKFFFVFYLRSVHSSEFLWFCDR